MKCRQLLGGNTIEILAGVTQQVIGGSCWVISDKLGDLGIPVY